MAVSFETVATALLMVVACGNRDAGQERAPVPAEAGPEAPAIEVAELSVDAAAAPRGDRPFIAGEGIRIGFTARGGHGPYRARVVATGAGDRTLLDAAVDLEVAGGGDAALGATLDRTAPSGTYHLTVDVTGAGGARGRSQPLELRVIGDGTALVTEPSPIEILDAGGRRRAELFAGETVTVRATLDGAGDGPALVRLWDPTQHPIAATDRARVSGGVMTTPIAIPRLARSGTYGIQVDSKDGRRARAVFRVRGPEHEPLYRLTVESMELYGGPDGRAPILGRMPRSYPIHVEAVVGGGEKQVSAVVRWHVDGGPHQLALPAADVIDPAPDGRTRVRGTVEVPKDVPSGRVRFEIEVTEDQRVSSIYREMLVE